MRKFGYYLFAALTTIILPTACMEKLQVSPNPETVLSEPETYAKQISESMLFLEKSIVSSNEIFKRWCFFYRTYLCE